MRILIDLVTCEFVDIQIDPWKKALEFLGSLIDNSKSNEIYCIADPIQNPGYEDLRQVFIRKLPIGHFLSFQPYKQKDEPANGSFSYGRGNQLISVLFQHAIHCIDPDVVLSFSSYPDFSRRRTPTVLGYKNFHYPHVIYLGNLLGVGAEYPGRIEQDIEEEYQEQIQAIKNHDLILVNSDAARGRVAELLGVSQSKVVNVSNGDNVPGANTIATMSEKEDFLLSLGISKEFVLLLARNSKPTDISAVYNAYSSLPQFLRQDHQLVILETEDLSDYQTLATSSGISEDEYVPLGDVTKRDFLSLAQYCKVLILLTPVEDSQADLLDVMRFGTPIILDKYIGDCDINENPETMFDTSNQNSIFELLRKSLSNKGFRENLAQDSIRIAKNKIIKDAADRTWEEFNALLEKRIEKPALRSKNKQELRVAFLSPLPPERSGISAYSFELLASLSEYLNLDLFVNPKLKPTNIDQLNVDHIFSWKLLPQNIEQYATVVYQFGNSPFHAHMYDLVRKFPGVLVLHDFFIGHLIKYLTFNHDVDLPSEIDYSHGLQGLLSYESRGFDVIWDWPINWRLFKYSKEVIAHSPYHCQLIDRFYHYGWRPKLNIVPQLRKVEPNIQNEEKLLIRKSLGIDEDCVLFCSFGQLEENKCNILTIEAFIQAQALFERNCKLIFVGFNENPQILERISEVLRWAKSKTDIVFTGHIEEKEYSKYLQIADVAIQLRSNSRGETSRAILDCMANGVPVILNEHGTNADYEAGVIKVSDPVNKHELTQVMIDVSRGKFDLDKIGDLGRAIISSQHNPDLIAEKYAEIIERATRKDDRQIFGPAIKELAVHENYDEDVFDLSRVAARNLSMRKQARILVDVNAINRLDLKTGIQRVVKRILSEWFASDDLAPFIEPVFPDGQQLYRASQFTARLLGCAGSVFGSEKKISIESGDILLFLDAAWGNVDQYKKILPEVKQSGGKIVTVVYDLIPLVYPQFTDKGTPNAFIRWLEFAVEESDVLVCISQTVAEAIKNYLKINKINIKHRLDIKHFHLGADIPTNAEKEKKEDGRILSSKEFSKVPVFLMVGTVEPRKGHKFVLDRFEEIWKNGNEDILIIAGKVGWNVEELQKRIQNHPMLGNKLYYIEAPSDTVLNMLYSKATALISASIVEGFGLPLIEAALHNVPVIASDIPVFHEVAGNGALYFSLNDPDSFNQAIMEMKNLSPDERKRIAKRIKVLSWKESAQRLLEIVLGECESY